MMTFKSVNTYFPGNLLIILFYVILSWDIQSTYCGDYIAPMQVNPAGVYHYNIRDTTNPKMKYSNYLSVRPRNVDKYTILQAISVLVGIVAILIMIKRCLKYLKSNGSIRRSIRRLSTNDDENGACQSATGAAAAPVEVPPVELETHKKVLIEEMTSMCKVLDIKEGNSVDGFLQMAPEHAKEWMYNAIEMAEAVLDKHDYDQGVSDDNVLLLVNERNTLLREVKEIKIAGNPTVFLATKVLLPIAAQKMEGLLHVKLTELRSLLEKLTGEQFIELQADVSYVKPIEDKTLTETGDNLMQAEAFIKACETLIPALIKVNNLTFSHLERVSELMERLTLSDKELLDSIKQGPAK